jgi:methylmalonyl-CoA/ethylmalonyl-CoA epimerase
MAVVKKINHIAILVEDIDESLLFWQGTLGIQPSDIKELPSESARIAFLPLGESEIELVQPTLPDTGLSRYLAKRGEGLHHLCVEVDDLSSILQEMKSKGTQLINEEPRLGEDGRLYAFVHPKSTHGVLLELYQLPK